MASQAKASQLSAKISAKASQSSAAIAQNTFRVVERPSLGVEATELIQFVAGKEIVVIVRFKNSGHMPARVSSVLSHLETQKARDISTPCPEPGKSEIAGLASRSPIPINGAREAYAHSFSASSDADIKRIEDGEWWLYVHAIARYEGSGNSYFTEYYARYNPKSKRFEECGTHNDAN